MKKKAEIRSNNPDPFAVINYCKEVLKEYGQNINPENLNIFKKEQKKDKTTEYYGNEECGVKNAFSRNIEMGVAYTINSEYTLYGLKDKNKLVIKRAFHTSVWEENEMELFFSIKGKADFIEFNEKLIKQRFPAN